MASAKDFSGSSEEPATEVDPPNSTDVNLDDDKPPVPGETGAGGVLEDTQQSKDQGSTVTTLAEEENVFSSNRIAVVYFTVGDNHETALVPVDAPPDDIRFEKVTIRKMPFLLFYEKKPRDMFRAAAEAGPCDIVKLYTPDGRLINISPTIPPNTPSTPYRLEVMAVHCNAIVMEQVGMDLLSLEKRVAVLECCFHRQSSPHESVQELKEEVNQLRTKLENHEHLSWLGFYKALHPPPVMDLTGPVPLSKLGPGYHRRSKEAKQLICDKFLRLSDVVLTKETCQLIKEPTFDNWQWEDEEMLVLLQQMYLELELPKKFDIEINILRNFLVRVYHNYNDVPFHNFRHCFCVTQMMFGMTCSVNLSERIGDLETLILLTSCICHDLDHPGYNNIYQINAQTELALRYNDISPLENHHCSVAFRILEDPECNIFRNLSSEMYKKIREGMIRCILATDMARHNEIVNQFREVVPYFDRNNKVHVNLLTMVLIKVADISNEARPMNVAEPWLDCLLAQSDTEKLEGLPVTPFMDREKITKPSSQCSFIGLVLLPLFEVLVSFFPELDPMILQPVRDALDYYRRLNEASQPPRHRKSTDVTAMQSVNPPPSTQQQQATDTSDGAKLPSHNSKEKSEEATTAPSSPSAVTAKISSPTKPPELPIIPVDPPQPTPPSVPMAPRNSNPLSYRRASQLLMLKASGSSNSLKVSNLQPLRSSSSGNSNNTATNFQSFPSVESESDRDEDECGGSEEEAITEVAVSEKALKFKIATEPSFDLSASRKGSRENKSESSGQSTSATKDDRISFDTSYASTPKVEFVHGSVSSTPAIVMEQVGMDLLSLEKRVAVLECCFHRQSSPHESVQELKEEVNQLRTKLENHEHLSWLGFYKALHPPPVMDLTGPVPVSKLGPGYHRRSKEAKQLICDKFLRLSDVVLTKETCQLIKEPTFDNWQWEDEEMLVLLQQMYLELELPKKFDIEINILRNFLVRVYHNYNDVPFHNFRHCFCVTQMMFGMTCSVNLSERIGDLETLILLTSCICHDLDHPGYNNIYQINAQTELALRYNDISPLENHHCSVAFRILEDPECNIFRNLSSEMYKKIREGMIRCILATDMARHNEIVNQFREVVPYFDRNNKVHVNLLTMVLIKVADISNEARPMNVAEPWLDCLLAEFFQQSDTEKLEGLPVTPFMDREKITKPSSQCSFIGLVLLPLFEVLVSFFPELDPMILQPVRDALDYYRRLNEASQPPRHRKSTDVTAMQSVNPPPSTQQQQATDTSDGAKLPSDNSKEKSDEATTAPSSPSAVTAKISSPTKPPELPIIPVDPPQPTPPSVPMAPRNSNPLSYRRASQLLMLKASGSSNSLKVSNLQPLRSSSSGNSNNTATNFQSFPSVESESDRDEDECGGSEEEAITEVAVSEKALKFKIATEPSFDLSASRKGSRENKSESSGQSTSATKDDRISFDTSYASTPKVEFVHGSVSSTPGKHISSKPTTSTASSSSKTKPKDSFFSRLRLFTERLSMSADSTTSGGSGCGSESPPVGKHAGPGFNYFRKGRKDSKRSKSKDGEHYQTKHRGSSSDPEGHVTDEKLCVEVGKENLGGGSELASPDCSPALSGASAIEHRRSSWKHCSGSLDSVLSKDDNAKRSPSRRLMLPRFSSFVQKKTRMGFMMRRSSPKGSNPSEPQS